MLDSAHWHSPKLQGFASSTLLHASPQRRTHTHSSIKQVGMNLKLFPKPMACSSRANKVPLCLGLHWRDHLIEAYLIVSRSFRLVLDMHKKKDDFIKQCAAELSQELSYGRTPQKLMIRNVQLVCYIWHK